MNDTKTCVVCGQAFAKRPKSTWADWAKREVCSVLCARRNKESTPAVERIKPRLVRRGDCLVWPGATTPQGKYGVAGAGGRHGVVLVHRAMYEHHFGPIPEAYEVDHLCRVTLCCNPAHLEAVTKAENLRRQQAAITHCIRGHEFTEENTYHPPGRPTRRQCRTCTKLRAKGQTIEQELRR